MTYIDAHLHLVPESELIKTQKGQMASFIMNATKVNEWESVLALANRFHGYACLGIHPWYVASAPAHWDTLLAGQLQQNSHIMIGEIGLDKGRPDFDKQLIIFQKSLTLAQVYNRAVHIHCVKAWDVMVPLLRPVTVPVLLHRFSGSAQIVKQLNRDNIYFSVIAGRPIPDEIPTHKILVESDAPGGLASPALIPTLSCPPQTYQNTVRFLTLAHVL